MAHISITGAPVRRRDVLKILRGKFEPYVVMSEQFLPDPTWHPLVETDRLRGHIMEGNLGYRRWR